MDAGLSGCLILRLLKPEQGATRFSSRIPLSAWCLLPGLEQLPEISVVIEERQEGRTEQSAGLLLFGRELNFFSAGAPRPASAFLSQGLRLTPAARRVETAGGPLPGHVVDISGELDVEELVPPAGSPPRLLAVALIGRLGGAVTVSEAALLSLPPREEWERFYGGFIYPSAAGAVHSNHLALDGWAARRGDRVTRVEVSVNGRTAGEAVIGLRRPELQYALPDLEEIAESGFSILLTRGKALPDSAADGAPVNISACVSFRSGVSEVLHAPALIWLPDPRALPHPRRFRGCLQAVYRQTSGELAFEGWFLDGTNTDYELALKTRSGRVELGRPQAGRSANQPLARPDVAASFPTLDSDLPPGFRAAVHPQVLGRFPGPAALYANTRFGEFRFEPAKMGEAAEQLAQEESGGFFWERLAARALRLTPVRDSRRSRAEAAPGSGPFGSGRSRTGPPERIAVCSHNLSAVEGAPKVLLQVLRFLAAGRIRPENLCVVSPYDGALRHELQALGAAVHVLPQLSIVEQSWSGYHQALQQLMEIFKQHSPDLVYANVIDAFWGIDAADRLGVPGVWAIHESVDPARWYLALEPRLRMLFLHCLGYAARTIFVARATEEMFLPYVGKGASVVIPNTVDLAQIEQKCSTLDRRQARKMLHIPEEARVVSVIGTTTYRKGQDIFLREMAFLKRRMPDSSFCFLIVGARELDFLDELRRLATELEVQEQVRFVPETRDVAPFFIASDVAVVSSREESAPLVSLESFAFGIPLVSSTVFGLAEQIDDGENALAFNLHAPESLARKVQQILEDPELGARLVSGGKKTLAQRYSPHVCLAAYWSVLCAAAAITPD